MSCNKDIQLWLLSYMIMGFIYCWSRVLNNDESQIARFVVKEIIIHSKFVYGITIHGVFFATSTNNASSWLF
jgi:hypothetical protein